MLANFFVRYKGNSFIYFIVNLIREVNYCVTAQLLGTDTKFAKNLKILLGSSNSIIGN